LDGSQKRERYSSHTRSVFSRPRVSLGARNRAFPRGPGAATAQGALSSLSGAAPEPAAPCPASPPLTIRPSPPGVRSLPPNPTPKAPLTPQPEPGQRVPSNCYHAQNGGGAPRRAAGKRAPRRGDGAARPSARLARLPPSPAPTMASCDRLQRSPARCRAASRRRAQLGSRLSRGAPGTRRACAAGLWGCAPLPPPGGAEAAPWRLRGAAGRGKKHGGWGGLV